MPEVSDQSYEAAMADLERSRRVGWARAYDAERDREVILQVVQGMGQALEAVRRMTYALHEVQPSPDPAADAHLIGWISDLCGTILVLAQRDLGDEQEWASRFARGATEIVDAALGPLRDDDDDGHHP